MAVFNCSMPCSQQLPVTWYMTLPTNGRTVPVSPYTSLTQVKNIYGIEVSRGTVNECPQGGYLVEQLFVKVKQQFHLMPVQCSTVCISGDCSCGTTQVYFSKLSMLYVAGEKGTIVLAPIIFIRILIQALQQGNAASVLGTTSSVIVYPCSVSVFYCYYYTTAFFFCW